MMVDKWEVDVAKVQDKTRGEMEGPRKGMEAAETSHETNCESCEAGREGEFLPSLMSSHQVACLLLVWTIKLKRDDGSH
jgi:hypothetical protein